MAHILVTGGAGFIGSNYVRWLLRTHPEDRVTVLDKLTYAGRLENLADVVDNPRFHFVRGDIANPDDVEPLLAERPLVASFAAESHVDRSILDPTAFIRTAVFGTYTLMEAARKHGIGRFVLVSTDEVYGSVVEGSSKETDALDPRSPYSASKASADLLARSYFTTYGVPVMITRGSNTFGPYQYPEKILPLFITNAIDDQPLPVYGDGRNVRDWLYVLDHCAAIDLVLREGEPGEIYNVGGGNERPNIEVTRLILDSLGKPHSLIQYVADRPGHDRRYSLDSGKLRHLGWQPRYRFEDAFAETVRWYVEHPGWWRAIKSGDYTEYYRRNYAHR
ncbi:MAG: dTDP-glucose 4,6-dehydratase [Chloroflexi bacterium]|nr:dTDP-glucose 4,6-dehydratase [Chloroflexota bacterium]